MKLNLAKLLMFTNLCWHINITKDLDIQSFCYHTPYLREKFLRAIVFTIGRIPHP